MERLPGGNAEYGLITGSEKIEFAVTLIEKVENPDYGTISPRAVYNDLLDCLVDGTLAKNVALAKRAVKALGRVHSIGISRQLDRAESSVAIKDGREAAWLLQAENMLKEAERNGEIYSDDAEELESRIKLLRSRE